ncbi:general secretion pathway protein GspB [Shewanella sp. KT0246]|uniref:general secretion pathway protein GspB n=1 Tax=Shewanella sp. KT0246 TaxID=2815912 RepID=UPI001BBE36E2|nr:general secretion pathway protein GspB [Shewanella sp. KT0246]GIU47887.1 general secretion pathway protein GspB [Shewanella sp. KT0246]
MSILLDAVTKEKQQQMGELPDAVLTPRANYQQVASHAWLKYLVLAGVIIAGVASAWGLSKIIAPSSSVKDTIESQVTYTSARTENSNQNSTTEDINTEPSSEVRIASKVALPIAKPLSQVNGSTQFVSRVEQQPANDVVYDYRLNNNRGEVTTNNQPKEQSYSQSSYSSGNASNQQTRSNTASVNDYSNFDSTNTGSSNSRSNNSEPKSSSERQLTAAELQALYGDEAIILGANSNYRKPSDLDALRMKVSAAASDVNYEQQSQRAPIEPTNEPVVDNSNNLMAAFEAALKEVEYENSANAPVTAEKLDPIPTTPKQDEIPPYGQLPASVQLQVPEFNIQAHVYSSAAENRWLNVDGKELQEGDTIKGKLEIIEIRPRDVVLEIDGSKFKVPAI